MKTSIWRAVLTCLWLGVGLCSANAQVLDHLRALTGTRFPVGDPSVTVSNINGLPTDGPKDIAIADLDGDGKRDFAASDKDGSITVYFGQGDGTFGAPLHLRTWTTAPADPGGFSVTNYVTNYCNWVWTNNWESNGIIQTNWSMACIPGETNITAEVHLLSDGPTGLRGLALADFTGDGLRDIAVASPGESVVYLLINEGDRHFAAATQIPAWFGVRDLAAGDFDGDGLIDFVAAGTTNGIAQFRSLGNGAFEVATNLPSVGSKDLDNDFPQPAFYIKAFRPPGAIRDEIAIGRAGDHPVKILAANSAGLLERQATLTNVVVHALDVGPLLHNQADGTLDLVSVNHDDDILEIRAGKTGADRFETNVAQSISVPGRAHGVAIADLDNDGWNDLVVVLQRFEKVRVFRNVQGTFEAGPELSVGSGPRELAVGDFTGDGRTDAAVLNRVSSDVSILLAHPTAFGFSTLDMIYPADGEVVALQVFDFNGDGRDDVVQIHRASGEMSVRLARNDGSLSDAVFFSLGSKPSDMRVVDVNGDHIVDILAVDLEGFVSVRLGLGDGGFGAEIRSGLHQGTMFAVTTGDLDGDGLLDVAVGYLDCRVGLFKGNGDGSFVFIGRHYLGYEPRGLVCADFDGDGDLDLLTATMDGNLVIVKNQGDLMTTTNITRVITPVSIPGGRWGISLIYLTEYNDDGDPDLIVNTGGGPVILLGGPGLQFTYATNLVNTPIQTVSSVSGDFNNDGRQDVIAACPANCVSVSLGNSTGGFDPAFLIPVPSSQLIAAGDLDGDGLPDLIGTGEVLWTALSSRGPGLTVPPLPSERRLPGIPLINEVLAANSTVAITEDGGRKTDFVELFNGGQTPLALANWRLRLERTNNGVRTTNEYRFPTTAILDTEAHLVLVCSETLRSPLHTGFTLPAEGGTLCLIRPDITEADRVVYPAQESDHAYARYQDGVNGFVVTDTPTPGRPNADTGLMPPELSLDSVDLASLRPDQAIRFFGRAKDDLGVVNLSVLWRRLDVADDVTKRVILYDDGLHQDGGSLDGLFSGVLEPGLPEGAEIQFYLECTDLSGQTASTPGDPRFVTRGQKPSLYTLAVGWPLPSLEISEVVARNTTGLQDELGKHPDWIEIRNCSAQPVSLNGASLGPNFFGDGGAMVFSNGITLNAGQHLVIYADGKPEAGGLHAPFKLNRDGDHITLTGVTDGGARYLIDSLQFPSQPADTSLARLGCGGPWVASVPTPRAANVVGSYRTLVQSNTFLLAYPTQPGRTYTVEYKNSLTTPSWTPAPAAQGIGLEQTIQQPLTTNRFFRVREQQ
jgi:hypothetical protein